ncbi:MAG: DUF362 domain-containing protein [Anaerolineae bacterium]|nr:DUF362 domain-containing protein [Anaerolineae bacterium]
MALEEEKECRGTRAALIFRVLHWLVGLGALLWLLWRSGSKPHRLSYPCQRLAAAHAAAFLTFQVADLVRLFFPARPLGMLALLLTLLLSASTAASSPSAFVASSPDLPGWTSPTAISNVFVVTHVPEPQYSLQSGRIPAGVAPDAALRDAGVDTLVALMEANGDYFYRTAAHPNGLFGPDDVIVIKVNNQWDRRNATNSDVLKGVIYRLVKHPEGFSGAVIVAENPQGTNEDWYNEPDGNINSQFRDQSYQEVTQAFARQGYRVCIADWRPLRETFVRDYDAGDSASGYVAELTDSKLSYPKFQVNCNGRVLRISMKKGIWNGTSFDNERLKMINLPVLKRHSSAWATIAVKNYIGFITTAGSNRWVNPSHLHCWLLSLPVSPFEGRCTTQSQEYGLLGRQMARIRRADLDIVDAIWVNPCDNGGYNSRAQRQNVLLASRDPFAVDYYASDYVLYPLALQMPAGACPGGRLENIKASHRGGTFRTFLMRNAARMRAEGITDIITLDDNLSFDEERFQFNVYVADARYPVTSTLTLLAPNGGERWIAGSLQEIRWTSTNLAGGVRLEYSTDGFSSAHEIAAETPNNGTFTWSVPYDYSANVAVRVSAVISPAISDTSDAPFAITGPRVFTDSFKRAIPAATQGGEMVTYTIVLYEGISATVRLTDVLPAELTYITNSARIAPEWKGELEVVEGSSLYWTGVITGGQSVTVTFRAATAPITQPWAIVNRAFVSRNNAPALELPALVILNGWEVYLPVVCASQASNYPSGRSR